MKKTLVAIALATLIIGCSKSEQRAAVVANAAPRTAVQTPAGHPPVAGAVNASLPAQDEAAPAGRIVGTIVETMNSGGYTYMKVKTGAGSEWVATPEAAVKKGQTVTVLSQMTTANFKSSSLHRTFDQIVFGTLEQNAPPVDTGVSMASMLSSAPEQKPQMPAGHPSVGGNGGSPMGSPSDHMKPRIDTGDIKVERAPGGKIVAELWADKASLKDKPVIVRGKVVKFLGGIMGKNWVHVRDGSGSAEKGDNDITVTTNEVAQTGDTVTITGVLRVDKDFGAGYLYPVIIEDAKISK